MSGYLLKFKQTYSVKIGGRRYPVVKIGNQLWMAENLDYAPSGVSIGSNAWYYNDDETTYGWNGYKYGLLYNKEACDIIISNITDDWRVPTDADYTNLVQFVGVDFSTKLKSKTGWSSNNGIDSFGFNGVPSGYKLTNSFYDVGNYGEFRTSTITNGKCGVLELSYNDNESAVKSSNSSSHVGLSIRLVKSLT